MALRPIYYDTETTGLKKDKDRIIEIAAYDPVNEKTFALLVNPKMEISQESIAICGITNEMVKDAPGFDVAGKEFSEFCSGEVVLIAHNNDAFDKFFIEEEFKRANLVLPNWPYIDSLKWARKYRYDLPRHALQYLREIYGVEANQAHRALDDVIVLYRIFSQMIGDLSMETILELLSKPSKPSDRMPFGKYQGKELKDVPKSYVMWLDKSGAFQKEENKELKSNFENLGILTKENVSISPRLKAGA